MASGCLFALVRHYEYRARCSAHELAARITEKHAVEASMPAGSDHDQVGVDIPGLLRRYASDGDGLQGAEGVFCCCSFWMAECLAYQGRLDAALAVFKTSLQTGNDPAIFSEEYDPRSRQMLGNFPQGLTHLSLIAAAAAINEMEGQRELVKKDEESQICLT